jgi:hypothetical protein
MASKTNSTPVFGLVTIDGKCSSEGCGGEPASVMPWRTREDGTNVVWACAEHAQAMDDADVPMFEITRTCGFGGDTPCGAFATYVAVVGVPETKQLGIVSACEHHAAGLKVVA